MTCARRLRVAFAFGSGVLAAGAAQACEASWAEFAALGDYDATSAQASPVYLEVGFKDEEACARASVSLVPATDAPAAAYRSRSARLVGAGGRMLRLEANGDAPHGSRSGRSVGGARSFPVFRIAPHQFEPSGVYAESFQLLIDGKPQGAFNPELRVFVAPAALFRATEIPLEIDFGSLSSGPAQERRPVIVSGNVKFLYQATSSATMIVKSDGDGRLIHERGAEFTPIRYSVTINGAPMALGVRREVDLKPGAQGTGLIEVTLENIGMRYAGKYADRLTVSIVGHD
ncbi:hypothetical protein [Neomegalonema perideroedes]|uniref:hypothetical protein n=1 Tax=Neomegalonema perideroedes TaxID=217219 RepID=UPI0012FDA485|nr:hypothetical protein [Neomegalonema perideroedes]